MITILALLQYAPFSLVCPVAADAPIMDQQLHHNLLGFREMDRDVAKAVLPVMGRHVWYLRPQAVTLALCSSKVSPEVNIKLQPKCIVML